MTWSATQRAKLPIFRHYDIGEVVHSSSDGQKFETGVRTFNARHSPKYFGLKKGIVTYRGRQQCADQRL